MSNHSIVRLLVRTSVAAMFVLFAGCRSGVEAPAAREASVASEGGAAVPVEASLVPLAEAADGRPIFTHRLVASARFIRFEGAMPVAKGQLAFLADEAALRSGAIALTKAEADAALAELVRVTGQEVQSTLTVSVPVGNLARMVAGQAVRYPVGWKQSLGVDGGWVASGEETRTIGVGLTVWSQLVTDGRIRLEVKVDTTELDGFVEHEAPTEKTTVLTEFFALANVASGVQPPPVDKGPHAKPFFEPLFSTHEVTASARMKSGETIVLRGGGARKGTILVFLTAIVEPLVKSTSSEAILAR